MRKWLIEFLLRLNEPATGMSEDEQWEILLQVKSVEKFDKLLRALISADIASYFSLPEENKEMRWIKKGSVMRLRWLRTEMDRAEEKLNKLKGKGK